MPDWPAFMPQPVLSSIRIGAPTGGVLRTSMDAGPAKQRRRFTASPRPVSMAFEPLTAVQISALETFFEQELSGGAVAFNMPHPITDLVSRFRFIADEEPYGIVPIGKDAYRVDVIMELLP